MPARLDIPKVIQAIAVLLNSTGRSRLEYLSLLKMLYIADRESLAERGADITGDRAVAMEHGPVLSEVYDLINLNHGDLDRWTRFLRKEEYDLELLADPGVDQLAPYELRKLREVAQRYEKHSWRDLVRVTHEFPEWQRNQPDARHGPRMRPIPFRDILRAVGREEDAEWILQDRKAVAALEEALGG